MIAMQYSIALPTSYSIEKLRSRVIERLPLFNNRVPGLIHKSFLLDSESRRYAPFYIWGSHDAMRDFYFSDVFSAIVAAFGRPRIRHWSILRFDHADRSVYPKFACYEIDRVPQDMPMSEVQSREIESHHAALKAPGLYARVVGLDSDRWELVRYSLWSDVKARPKSGTDCTLDFEVMDIAEPKAGAA